MDITVEAGGWDALRAPCTDVRITVFVDEQGVPLEEEIDALDPGSTHYVARDASGETLGCARMTPEGRIGRIAVYRPHRGRGVGRALMRAVLADARSRGLPGVTLHAQTHARGFYEGFGFAARGDVFDECGIPHVAMTLEL